MLLAVLLFLFMAAHVGGGVTFTAPSLVNCGEDAVFTCSGVTSSTRTWRTENGSIMINGTLLDPKKTGKYTETVQTNYVKLTVHNTSVEDHLRYGCASGFEESPLESFPFECKAKSAMVMVDRGKHVKISVGNLYPADSLFRVYQSGGNDVMGSNTCSASSSGYFSCEWISQTSTAEGNYEYNVMVKTVTYASPITVLFRIVNPKDPVITNRTIDESKRSLLYGTEGKSLVMECISREGLPQQTVNWYKNQFPSVSVSSNLPEVKEQNGTFTVTARHTLTPDVTDDKTVFICKSYYPDADVSYQALKTASVLLLLTLKPSDPVIVSDATRAGSSANISCYTTDSRPEASLYFEIEGTSYYGSFTATKNEATEKYKSEVTLILPVTMADNGKEINCFADHPALTFQTSAELKLNVLFAAQASSTKIFGNQNIVADGNTTLTLECKTGSSNPASNITWLENGQRILISNESYSDIIGPYKGIVRSQKLVLRPNRTMDGMRIKCEVSNGISGLSDSFSVALNINYSSIINKMTDVTVVQGNVTQLECTAWSKPPSLFKWFKSNLSTILANGYGTKDSNGLSYKISQVQRSDDGLYLCQAENGIMQADVKTLTLTVHYPPIITIEYKNVSVNDKRVILRCATDANPKEIRYRRWYRQWPGAEIETISDSANESLQLVNLTYAYSGVYTCSASNDIIEFSTGETFTNGSAYLLVKSFPVIVDPNPEEDQLFKVTGRLKRNATFYLDYYSNVDQRSTQCFKVVNGSHKEVTCWTTNRHVKVALPVFTQNVFADGVRATVSLPIESEDDFAYYNVEITNMIGSAVLPLQIVPSGPPAAPFSIQVYDIGQSTAHVSWISGFSGDLNQTIVIQLSKDEINWRNTTQVEVYNNQKESISLELSNLENAANYVLRMFAFNFEGRSEFSDNINFTTLMIEASISRQGALIGGIAGGISALIVLVAGGVIAILLKRRGYFVKEKDTTKLQSPNAAEEEDGSDDDGMKPNPLYVSAGPVQQMEDKVYAKPFKKKQADMTNTDIYSEVIKPKQTIKIEGKQKKGKPIKGKQIRDGDIYENSPGPSTAANTYGNAGFDNTYEMTDKPGKATSGSVNKDGLVYADLEFNPSMATKGKKLVIHGSDDRTEYVEVDFKKRAEPLPESYTEDI